MLWRLRKVCTHVQDVPEKSCQIKPWEIFEKMQFFFFNAKNWPIFASFEPFFPSHSILLTFGIELMLPNDGQILVDDFRHQNFGIWTFLG